MARKSPADEVFEEEIEYVSKTQLKRDAKDIRDLGERIVKLSPQQRQKLPLNEEIVAALEVADKIRNTREGLRRQLQFIGKLLRNCDLEPIQLELAKLSNTDNMAQKDLNVLEKIRSELLEQGDSKVNALVAQYPDFERQKLRQLVRKTLKQQQQTT